jgi:hypothetical protein
MSDWVITYYKRTQPEPVKTRHVKGLDLGSVQVMADEWREWTNGYATIEPAPLKDEEPAPEPSPAGITDHRGTRHLVSIDRERHDFWTAAGELKARCTCGWVDYQPYTPDGESYARLRLQYRAADHLPRPAKQRRKTCPTPASSRPTATTSVARSKQTEPLTRHAVLAEDSPQPAPSTPHPKPSDWSLRPTPPSPALAA